MSVKMKLILSFFVVVLINIGFGLYSMRSLYVINGRVVEANSWTVGISQLGSMQFSIASLRRYDLNYIQQAEDARKENTMRNRAGAIKGAEEVMGVYRSEVLTIPYDTEEQRQEDLEAIDLIIKNWNAYLASSQKLLDASDAKNGADVVELVNGDSLEKFEALEQSVADLIKFNEEGCAEVMLMSEDIYRATERTILALLAAAVAFSAIVPVLLVRGIRRSVNELLRVSESIEAGDLTVTAAVFADDEFGNLARRYNHTIASIKSLVSNIQDSASLMSQAALDFRRSASQSSARTEMITRSIESVSLQSEKQRAETESITTAIDGMAGGIEDMTETLDSLSRASAESVRIAGEGGKSMERAIAQMSMIESAVNTSSEVVAALGMRSGEIGRIVGTIADISSQTNLLALNAAIEAARAGEQGRGFAVVAEEVKKLAGESQAAAEEISHLISSIQDETSRAVEAMANGREEAQKGSLAMDDGGRAFGELAQRSVGIADGVTGIAAVMHKMSSETSGVASAARSVEESGREIARSSQSVVAAAQEQSASMSEVSDSSQKLTGIASDMLDSTKRFSV
jgi:methyl-accepting chemotaxis protein